MLAIIDYLSVDVSSDAWFPSFSVVPTRSVQDCEADKH
jgi:hypothetical protein